MASTSVLRTSRGSKSNHPRGPHNLTVLTGVLWIVGAAAAWNVALVLFHDLTTRLLR